jgi:hypothetical protein
LRPRPAGGHAPSLPGLEDAAQAGASEITVPAHSVVALGDLPSRATELTTAQRTALGARLRVGWPAVAKTAYGSLADTVARASAARWHGALSDGAREAMLWRLLRMGNAPYFVLGSGPSHSLRLRIATPWDWRQQYSLTHFDVYAQEGGQPRVGWRASIRDRTTGELGEVAGHVEVRWSHGRFGGLPEAKGYLDTPHTLVPGYFPLR